MTTETPSQHRMSLPSTTPGSSTRREDGGRAIGIRSASFSSASGQRLVVGNGDGTVTALIERAGYARPPSTSPRLDPDTIADVRSLPFPDRGFDRVLAAQILEHVRFETLDGALSEVRRVTRSSVVASVPQRGRAWELAVKVPFLRAFKAGGVLPARTRHRFDGQHYWELGAREFRRSRLEAALARHFTIAETFVVPDHPYHRFYVLTR